MANENKISEANLKKYTFILNEAIEALTRLSEDLTESLHEGYRTEAKCKIATINLKCIDRKFRTLLFDGEPPCLHCTTEYLEKKRKEREEVRQKLEAIRKEYYMQEEHMSKLTRTLQENERKLALQSIQCTHEGLLLSRLLWKATKPRKVLEMLTLRCTQELHDFLNLAEGCVYAFATTYAAAIPDENTDEYQYIVSLFGILTNLSSIPDGRLFLMWNPMGRALYSITLDIMETILDDKSESLKWVILISIYNILVNPFGRKLIFKHNLLRENLEGCLSPNNNCNIIGAVLHIIEIFVDDFIDDNEMISVLMYQLPLKQVHSLSKTSDDMSIRKIAQAIIRRIETKMQDCYNCPSCRKAITTTPTRNQPTHKKKKRMKRRVITKSVMTSCMSVCAECETDDLEYTTSESVINVTEEGTSCGKLKVSSSIICKPPVKKPSKKKTSIDKSTSNCREVCETPSLRAKGAKKLGVKTIFKPDLSKDLNSSSFQMRSHSTGNLCDVPLLTHKSLAPKKPKPDKLMNVTTNTVLCMLSKLDLDTYLRPSYNSSGIPFLTNDGQQKCICSCEAAKPPEKVQNKDTCVCLNDTEKPMQRKQSLKKVENAKEEKRECLGETNEKLSEKRSGKTKIETSQHGNETIVKVYICSDESDTAAKKTRSDQNLSTEISEKPAVRKTESTPAICSCAAKTKQTDFDKPLARRQSAEKKELHDKNECICPNTSKSVEKCAQGICECLKGIETPGSKTITCGQKPCICCGKRETLTKRLKSAKDMCNCLEGAKETTRTKNVKKPVNQNICACSVEANKATAGKEGERGPERTSSIKLRSTNRKEALEGLCSLCPKGPERPTNQLESSPSGVMKLQATSSVKIQSVKSTEINAINLQKTSSVKIQAPKEKEPVKERELCACSGKSDNTPGRKGVESSQSSNIKLQKSSSMKLQAVRSTNSTGRLCSMHSKVVFRTTSSAMKQRRKTPDKINDKLCNCSKEQESAVDKKEKQRINCGDECEPCLTTLPKLDGKRFSEDQDKMKDAQVKTDSQMFVSCTCHKEERANKEEAAEAARKLSLSRTEETSEKRKSSLVGEAKQEPAVQQNIEADTKKENCVSCGCGKYDSKSKEALANAETNEEINKKSE